MSKSRFIQIESKNALLELLKEGRDFERIYISSNAYKDDKTKEIVEIAQLDIDMAIIYANRVLLVNDGTLVFDGSPHEGLRDFEFLRRNRLVPTSLLQLNLDVLERTGQFYSAEELAHILK